ncbi:MAG: hypothetical protein LAP13_20710 [Acidobacteriia bacterium]|nr:hypothetical protein [Terriglobia bacterium]
MGDKERFVENLLEASLQRHYRQEPRAGLEARILAGVATRERAGRRRCLWAVAASMAAVVITVITLHGLRHRPAPVPTISQVAVPRPQPPVTFTFSQAKPAAPHPARGRLRHVAASQSRPAQFPTPRPLTESEKLLLVYTQIVPKEVLATSPTPPLSQDLDIPGLNIAELEIKPLPGSEPEAAK